jgi:hypothetical protein
MILIELVVKIMALGGGGSDSIITWKGLNFKYASSIAKCNTWESRKEFEMVRKLQKLLVEMQ